jgi:hypothetical protein
MPWGNLGETSGQVAGGVPPKSVAEVDADSDFASPAGFLADEVFCSRSRGAATAHFKRVGAIRQIIQSVLKVALISTSLTEKLEHHDAYRHEVIHTAGERLQQEV